MVHKHSLSVFECVLFSPLTGFGKDNPHAFYIYTNASGPKTKNCVYSWYKLKQKLAKILGDCKGKGKIWIFILS